MNLRIAPGWAAALALSVLVAAGLFVYLLGRFGGPSIDFSSPYELSVTVPDSLDLSARS
jgi:hypothetical protein